MSLMSQETLLVTGVKCSQPITNKEKQTSAAILGTNAFQICTSSF